MIGFFDNAGLQLKVTRYINFNVPKMVFLFIIILTFILEQGSADPKQNQKLAHLIEQAHHHNVPAEKIKQILQSSDPAKEDLRNYVFEIRGPGGSFFVCEVVTISHSKSRQSINTINRKLK